MSMSIMDWIEMKTDPNNDLTVTKFKNIRNYGTPEELKEAVEKMEAMGGYSALAVE